MYKTILFDLDGTLTDSGLGITNSVKYALKKYGIDEDDRDKLNKFVGPPLSESFRKYYNFSEEDSVAAIDVYREYYAEKGIFENEVYNGIPELIAKLKSSGKKVIVATAKPEKFAIIIMKHFGLDIYFDAIAGANMDETRTDKAEIIDYALNKVGFAAKNEIIMIGDRAYDIVGANKIGVDSIGVTYGYGSRKELEDAGATYIADTVSDICKIIESKK